ncbi:hypothetical protein [Sinorhizobium fredii]
MYLPSTSASCSGKKTTEPRHPDLASGKPWPILVPDPDVEDSG